MSKFGGHSKVFSRAEPRGSLTFVQYIAAFQNSAYDKAQSVLDQLSIHPVFSALRPVFLSIGGGDGTELDYLPKQSSAAAGVPTRGESRPLVEAADQRVGRLPSGKEMTIFEGNAKLRIRDAVTQATSLVAAGRGDYPAVTCHAVLHELLTAATSISIQSHFFATILILH